MEIDFEDVCYLLTRSARSCKYEGEVYIHYILKAILVAITTNMLSRRHRLLRSFAYFQLEHSFDTE